MSTPDEPETDDLAELVRDPERAASPELAAGARALRAELDAWADPEPPADLAQRTLARIALAGASPAAEEHEARGALEVLTTQPFAATPGTKRRGLLVRLCVQALAACLLFGISASFTALVYPAVVHALEEGRLESCQSRLKHLARALHAYRQDHPDEEQPSNAALRRALIDGGYAEPADFVCPGAGGDTTAPSPTWYGPRRERRPARLLGPLRQPPQGINVVYADARVELLDVMDFKFKPERR
ncbi:MAG: hypothetical protein R3F62_28760 [Planctomycetota bacterium]